MPMNFLARVIGGKNTTWTYYGIEEMAQFFWEIFMVFQKT